MKWTDQKILFNFISKYYSILYIIHLNLFLLTEVFFKCHMAFIILLHTAARFVVSFT